MTGRHVAPRPVRSGVWRPGDVALVGALGLVGGLGTQAYWTDQSTVTGATVQSGSLTMTVNGEDTDTYTWDELGISQLAPGESRAAILTIGNTGTTPFRISATGTPHNSSDPGLRSKMRFTVRVGGSLSNAPDATYPRTEQCTGGTLTYDAVLNNPGPDIVVAGGSYSDVGASGSLAICVQATLESNSDNSVQGKQMIPVFVFTATQQAS